MKAFQLTTAFLLAALLGCDKSAKVTIDIPIRGTIDVQVDGSAPAPVPAPVPAPQPQPEPQPNPTPQPTPTGYDLNTSAALLEGFNGTLTVIPPADHVALAPIGFQFGSVPNIDGFLKQNSCYRWLAGLEIPTTGEYVFRLQSKSGGSLRINGELLWSVDREGDPTSSPAHIFKEEFTRSLEGGRVCPVVLTLIYQGFYHGSILEWKRPGDAEFSAVTTDYLHPPADWQTRVKKYSPAPPEPSPFIIPDEHYRSPDIAGDIYPASSPWRTPIDQEPVDELSAGIIARMGTLHVHPVFGPGVGIPLEIVPPGTPLTNITFDYADESDHGPYPLTARPVVESGGGDGHWNGITDDKIYALFLIRKGKSDDKWYAGSGAIYDRATGERISGRNEGWTSEDAAGLCIVHGLVRPDEVLDKGEVNHALRISAPKTRSAYVWPATHLTHPREPEYAAADLPPMGCRLRLKSSVDESKFPPQCRPIVRAAKKYGFIVADNGSNFLGLCGVPDARWKDDELAALKTIKAGSFEVVKMGEVFE